MGNFHARVIGSLDGVELSTVFDADASRATEVAASYGCRPAGSLEEVLRASDGVVVAVPTAVHAEVAGNILDAGIPVLVEKPIAPTRAEAETLLGKAARKKLVRRPWLIEARRMGPKSSRIQDVGVVLDLMVHDIDIIQWLVGSPVAEVSAAGTPVFSEHEDAASAVLTFEGGCVASVSASRCTEEKFRTLCVSQEEAYISLDYGTQEIQIHRSASSDGLVERGSIKYRQASTVEHVLVHKAANPLLEEVSHFVRCVRGETEPLVSAEDVLRTMAITDSILARIRRKAS
jgi:predicted dehydrogenase